MSLCLLASACTSSTTDPGKDYAALQKELDANKSKWAAAAITHYQFDYMYSAFSINAGIWYTVEVNNGQVVSMKVTETQQAVSPDTVFVKTFEENFQQVQNAINAKANKITVTYDPTRGFVNAYYIDSAAGIADDELGISIKNVVIP